MLFLVECSSIFEYFFPIFFLYKCFQFINKQPIEDNRFELRFRIWKKVFVKKKKLLEKGQNGFALSQQMRESDKLFA